MASRKVPGAFYGFSKKNCWKKRSHWNFLKPHGTLWNTVKLNWESHWYFLESPLKSFLPFGTVRVMYDLSDEIELNKRIRGKRGYSSSRETIRSPHCWTTSNELKRLETFLKLLWKSLKHNEKPWYASEKSLRNPSETPINLKIKIWQIRNRNLKFLLPMQTAQRESEELALGYVQHLGSGTNVLMSLRKQN